MPSLHRLGILLNEVRATYHKRDYLFSDPLEFAHRYSNPWDQEAVGLISAQLAYGQVKQIRGSVESALARIAQSGLSPSEWVRSLRKPSALKKAYALFSGFSHRFNTGSDVVSLFKLLSWSWERHGSLGGHLLFGFKKDQDHWGQSLSRVLKDWRNQRLDPPITRSLDFFLSNPEDGSCCKRWCLFLRWMVRKDDLDLGHWGAKGALIPKTTVYLKPSQLIVPLDTHLGRISRELRFTQRSQLDWKAALEVTASLKRFDPVDPVSYDFALARGGILATLNRSSGKSP